MLESVLSLAIDQNVLTILFLTTDKLSPRHCLLEEPEKKLSFIELLERLPLLLVGILFTMQGFRLLYSSLFSSSFAFLLMVDNSKINYPFIFFVSYIYQWGPKLMTFF